MLAVAVSLGAVCVPPDRATARGWPPRLFVLAAGADLGARTPADMVTDVADAPDGSILVATSAWAGRGGTTVLRLTPGGRVRTLGRFTDFVRAIAADRGGAVLVLQENRVLRLLPSGAAVVLAGTGRPGFSGDGGPATSATMGGARRLRVEGGIARAADGSIAFTDSANLRVRRIRPDGVIETIAGGRVPTDGNLSPCLSGFPPGNGDGGPARLATLCDPSGLLVTADGGYIVADTAAEQVRRIAPDGTITTISGTNGFPMSLAQLPTGTLVVSTDRGIGCIPERYWCWRFGSSYDPGTDFTERGVQSGSSSVTLAATRDDGVLLGAQDLYFWAPRRVRRELVHISGARVDDRHVAVYLDSTRAARATLQVRLHGHTIARATRSIAAGRQRLEVRGRFGPHRHDVHVRLRARNGTAATDHVSLFLGGTLTIRDARTAMELYWGERGLSCRRVTRRTVKCNDRDADNHFGTGTATLGLDGVIRLHPTF